MTDQPGFEQLNADVKAWAKFQSQRMQRLVGSLTLKTKIALYKSVRNALRDKEYKKLKPSVGGALKQELGQVNRINFRFAKQGIWLERGVGKGRRANSSKSNPKPWLAPVLDPAIDELAALIAENYSDIAAGEIKFTVPGILARRVKISSNG